MIVYLDEDFHCHIQNSKTMLKVESSFFDEKCKLFIESWQYIPEGYSWTRDDGLIITGPTYICIDNSSVIYVLQTQYEIDEINHLNELGALIEDLYNADLEVIG